MTEEEIKDSPEYKALQKGCLCKCGHLEGSHNCTWNGRGYDTTYCFRHYMSESCWCEQYVQANALDFLLIMERKDGIK